MRHCRGVLGHAEWPKQPHSEHPLDKAQQGPKSNDTSEVSCRVRDQLVEQEIVYEKLPKDIADRHVLLMDPILATGNSAARAIQASFRTSRVRPLLGSLAWVVLLNVFTSNCHAWVVLLSVAHHSQATANDKSFTGSTITGKGLLYHLRILVFCTLQRCP